MSYIASISYGKDSLKMLDVIYTRGLPLDRIITFDVWATDNISADLPDVFSFKKNLDLYIFNKYGIEVEHHCARYPDGSIKTYEREFYRIRKKGRLKGCVNGFPYMSGSWCGWLKLGAAKGVVKPADITYVGIAYDEKKRYKVLNKSKVAPLVEYQIDEDLCGLHCNYEGILSPSYESSYRDGCWFCHNADINKLRNLRKNHPDLWSLLLKWDADSPNTFKADGHTVSDFDKRFALEEIGALPLDLSFRWSMCNEPRQLMFTFY